MYFDHDYPINPTVQHLYNTMDYQRACQLYLWGLPIIGVARWRQAPPGFSPQQLLEGVFKAAAERQGN